MNKELLKTFLKEIELLLIDATDSNETKTFGNQGIFLTKQDVIVPPFEPHLIDSVECWCQRLAIFRKTRHIGKRIVNNLHLRRKTSLVYRSCSSAAHQSGALEVIGSNPAKRYFFSSSFLL